MSRPCRGATFRARLTRPILSMLSYGVISRARATRLATSTAIGLIQYVNGLVHRGGSGVGFFVGGDVRFMLQRRADIVEALEQNFLARRRNIEAEHQAMSIRDGLVRQIHRQHVAFFFFRALE